MIGVLALQGDFREHLDVLARLGIPALPVKLPSELKVVDRLIIPGGESTTIGKLLVRFKLMQPIRARIKAGMPVWGSCAGAILLAKRMQGGTKSQPTVGVVDIVARRNAFGRQLDSFEIVLKMPKVSKRPVPVMFIRAPVFEKPGKKVEVLARLRGGKIVAAREGNILITAFHPELTGATALHSYFASL
ncbi:glutamine amidotransferase subunit PdxT [Candidatus Kaiserbacteria bacterium RIFCSPLOWO2_01_FULL_54_24]|uniref:Pyridoxal 5'-phosphate synthase subunit PdxT n=1 Tax=Candidatus Kaiserbacteria bacterium RIFCSPLOWO2_01_FULL_54_24 TaxID=1798515 RepID=A0A1F6ESS2_9BACT|nr:MAG: glutamine amidotransferase subunit PdxT [Candidatus Kaiserbacteria bacterium RIFCSPLOWO2_01_FULL_54_24]